jgi:hypothetical protein
MRTSTSVKIGFPFLVLIGIVSFGSGSVETQVGPLGPTNPAFTTSVETKILKPSVINQDCTIADHMSQEKWCNGLHPYGRACEGPEGPIAGKTIKKLSSSTIAPMSGWSDRYDNGTNPFPCRWFVSGFSRAYVKFDVKHVVTSGTVEGIEYAALSWKTKRLQGNQSGACSKFLYEATGLWDWKEGKAPTIPLFNNLDTTAINGGYYGVVKSVSKWFSNPDQNWGFVIEPSRNYTEQYSNSKCLESLEDLKLTVKYRVKQMQWPH